MKRIILIILCFVAGFTSNAQMGTNSEDLSIKIFMNNGEVIESTLVPLPIKFDLNYIQIKKENSVKKIKKKNIDRLTVENDEYINKSVYNASGKKVLKNKKLLKRIVSGKVSLYSNVYTVQESDPDNGAIFLRRTVYYCQKEGEEALTLINYDFENFDKNQNFKAVASLYFSDNESVLEKIDSGEFNYTNIVALVNEYNKSL